MNETFPSLLAAAVLLGQAAVPAQQDLAVFDVPVVAFPSDSSVDTLVDLDGDGDLDGIGWYWRYTNLQQANVRGFLNDGKGRFTPAWSFERPSGGNGATWAMAAGSFDRDKLGDFVLAFNSTVVAYTSLAAGKPAVYQEWQAGFAVQSAVVLDYDGDGLDDLVLGGFRMQLYRNTGTGFQLVSTLNHTATDLLLAELDGDGKPDLVAPYGPTVTFVSTANGALRTIASYTHGITLLEEPMVVAGDIDGDGDTDVVAFAGAGTYVTIRRTGPNQYKLEPRVTGGPATGLADVDGDGDLDGVCCGGGGPVTNHNAGKSIFHVSINDGGGAFRTAYQIHNVGGKRLAGAVDIDGDGDTDLVAGRSILYNDNTFAADPTPVTANLTRWNMPLVDVDRDGDLDALDYPAIRFRNDGAGGFELAAMTLPAAPNGTRFVGPGWMGDFDGDGDPDLIVGHVTTTRVLGMRLMENVAGTWHDAGDAAAAGTCFHRDNELTGFGRNSLVADVDGDGDLDILAIGRRIFIPLRVWLNNGKGFFDAGTDVLGGTPLVVTDLDGDGKLDILSYNAALRINWGLGTGQFAPMVAISAITTPGYDRIAVADLDGDGRAEIALTEGNNSLTVFVQGSNRTFTRRNVTTETVASSSTRPSRVDAIDVDGDGDTDLVVGPMLYAEDSSQVLFNDGKGGFPTTATLVLDPRGFADVDGDGDIDGVGARLARSARFVAPMAGGRLQFGVGIAGSGNHVPVLGARGPFRAGATAHLLLAGARGGATAILTVGLHRAELQDWPIPGLTGYVDPIVVLLPAITTGSGSGEGGLDLPVPVPASAKGAEFYMQAFVLDAGAAQGLAQTNGLELRVGR